MGGKNTVCLPGSRGGQLSPSGSIAADAYGLGSSSQPVDEGAFGRRVARACTDKRFFVMDQGSMGLAPAGAREGDVLTFFPTGNFPLVLRPCGGEDDTGRGSNG